VTAADGHLPPATPSPEDEEGDAQRSEAQRIASLRATLARIRIAGFKSFAEATTVEVLPGLTGIVGPNGCGKSNVVEALRWAEGWVVVYPTWMYGPPAILKGWLDRVMLPGVAFGLGGHALRPIGGRLDNIRHFEGITTSGSPWWWLRVIGDPGRSLFMRGLRPLFARRCRARWLQLHSMNYATREQRHRFLTKVQKRLGSLS